MLYRTQKAWVIGEKLGKLDFIKINNFCLSKESIKKNRQVIGREKIFAIHISDKTLYPEYIKNTYKQIIKRPPIQKWTKELNRHFTEEDTKWPIRT